jgi:transcriptional regulator with XRE-family HTH domain
MALDREATLDRNATIGRSRTGNGGMSAKNDASVHFGRLVAARRLEVGLSQEELAERMGTSQSRVALIEAGEPISPATRERLTDALGMEPEPNPLRRLVARAGGNGARITAEPIGRRLSGGLAATRGALERPAAALDLGRAKAALGRVPVRVRAFDGVARSRNTLSRMPKPALADGVRIPLRAAMGLAAAAVIAFLLSLIVVDSTWASLGLTAVTVTALGLSMLAVQRRADARVPVAIAAAIWLAVIAVGLISSGGNAEGSSNSPAIKTASAAPAAPETATLTQSAAAAAAILGSDAAAASRANSVPAKSHGAAKSDATAVPTIQPTSPSVASSTPSFSPSSSGGKPGAKPGSLSDSGGGGSSGSGSGSSSGGSTGSQSGSSGGSSGPIGNIVNSLGNAHQRP